jgi:hypothetical protein
VILGVLKKRRNTVPATMLSNDHNPTSYEKQAAMDDAPCDILGLAWDGLNNDNLQIQCSVMTCLAVIVTVFIASEATGNYSQVDKLWSIVPALVSQMFLR